MSAAEQVLDDPPSDETDEAIAVAKSYAPVAMNILLKIMRDESLLPADRIQAARHVLEVSGCLSL